MFLRDVFFRHVLFLKTTSLMDDKNKTCLKKTSLMTHIHWVARQNKLEIPRDNTEVNKWGIRESDGRAHDPVTMVVPLTPKPTRKAEVLVRATTTIIIVYYESIKRESKIRGIYECRCDERLQTKTKEFTRLPYTGLVLELEHLKIETRLINERFANAMGECEN
jgi:hypothetical protein